MKKSKTGAEKVRWDLNFLYSGIDDLQLDADVEKFAEMAENFHAGHNSKLSETFGKAISDYSEITMLVNKIGMYLECAFSVDVSNPSVKAKKADVERKFAKISGDFLSFFKLQIIELSDAELEKFYESNLVVLKHRPWIEQIRILKPHVLSEPVEASLIKRSLFGPGAWSEFYDEVENDLVFRYKRKEKTLTEMFHIMSESKDAKERFTAMSMINDALGGYFSKYSAQTLYMVSGSSAIENRERNYCHPMEKRNKGNRISDAVADALHKSILEVASPLAKRYYKLKAGHLGLKTLHWSDRNAVMPFADTSIIPFKEAVEIVIAAYENFSPTLAKIAGKMIEGKRVDAPAMKNKKSGAYAYSVVLPGNIAVSVNLLNYLGSSRDVMTMAHELGHAVHGILSGETQGVLMQEAPIAYAETASVFGEMTVFNLLKKQLSVQDDKKSLLALLMGKSDDILNTSVRQISFSNFERRLHGMDKDLKNWNEPKKLSPEELNLIWLETTKSFYGGDGEIFTYENMERMWAYIPHFHRPFYVYGYAFGELLTQSLYAVKDKFGKDFEPLYLDLLRAGGTKDAIELLKPFGLDPSDEKFWSGGIMAGLGSFVKEADELSAGMGVFSVK